MYFRKVIHILIIVHNYVFSKETADIIYNLEDNTLKNTQIGNVIFSATNQSPTIEYETVLLMNSNDLFELKKNGNIYTKVDIDRDSICVRLSCCKQSICTIKMKAHFFKGPLSFNVVIHIKDQNDNQPKFSSRNTSIYIPESADLLSNFKLPVAIDIDSDEFGIDSYRLIDSTDTFQNIMKNDEPYLRLLKPLDRETHDSYWLLLLVYDKGPRSHTSTLNLNVKLTDVNDNAPYFVKTEGGGKSQIRNSSGIYKIEIPESTPGGSSIYSFYANDDDEGENSRITYSISSALSTPSEIVQQKFSLESPNRRATIILRQSLDYEVATERSISLVIFATDNGKPEKSASISLTIKLTDVNDNLPVITETSPKDISENDGTSQQLKLFSISDKDSISHNKISCVLPDEIVPRFELKKIDLNVYVLNNKVKFDYELRRTEMVRVICSDKAEPEMTQTTDFSVNIIDENDNVPLWDKGEYHWKLSENRMIDTLIGTVFASDADSARFGKLRYNISEAPDEKYLQFIRINPETGDVRIAKPIDREQHVQLEYLVTVTDNLENNKDLASRIIRHSNTTKLVIEILDVNDQIPEFVGTTKYFKISEDSPVNTKLARLLFKDLDEPPNNIMTMTLLSYETNSRKAKLWFSIIDNDTIMVKNTLDREDINNISLIVQVVDQGYPAQTGTEKIFIEILDVNDNVPTLMNPLNNSFISGSGIFQSTPMNTKLVQLEASDLDNGSNGTITFKILQTNKSNPNLFKINEVSGDITTNWHSYEIPNVGVYSIEVLISDKGTPTLSTHVTLLVNITNISMNPSSEAYMSNIVILILIIVCSLALIVSLIAAIFWVRFRVSNDSPVVCQDEFFEREHLNKDINSHQYSLMNLDKTFRQNSYENNRLNPYETYQGFHHDSYIQSHNHSNYSHNTVHDVMDKSRMTPCEDCLTVYGTVPTQCNRFDTNLSRLRHPIIPDMSSTFSGNIITANPKSFILQSYCDNDYKTVPNIQPATLLVEPNFSDSGKGGSVEDLNYRQFTGISTFTNSSFVNTSSANAKIFCQNTLPESNVNQCLYDKSSETMF